LEEEVQATTDKMRQALEKLVTGKIKVAQPKNAQDSTGKTTYVWYTPGQQGSGDGSLRVTPFPWTSVLQRMVVAFKM